MSNKQIRERQRGLVIGFTAGMLTGQKTNSLIRGIWLIALFLMATCMILNAQVPNSTPKPDTTLHKDTLMDLKVPFYQAHQVADTQTYTGKNTQTPEGAHKAKSGSGLAVDLDVIKAPDFKGILTPSKIIWTIIFIFLGFLIMRLISVILNRIGYRSVKYRIAVKRLEPIIKITAWMFIIFIIVQGVIKPPNTMVIAFFTSISVAVGFAAQDLLKNIFGGLMILFDRPFQIGDKILVGSEYGEVSKIGLRSTRIVTGDDSAVTVPNSVMMNSSISNSNSGETNCQVVAEFFLPISTDTQKARNIAMQAARVSRYVFLNKPVAVVFFNEVHLGKSMYKMRLKAYVADLRYEFAFKSDMTEITIRELLKEGIITSSEL